MNQKYLITAFLASSIACHSYLAQAITVTSTYTYDGINRLTSIAYSTGTELSYFYDPAGNMTNVSTTLPPYEPALTDAMRCLQITAGLNPQGISTSHDVNSDGRMSLPEVIDALKQNRQ